MNSMDRYNPRGYEYRRLRFCQATAQTRSHPHLPCLVYSREYICTMSTSLSNAVRVQLLAEKVTKSCNTVFQYNCDTGRLRRIPIVPEPCANEECVCPFELQDHRVTHRVLGPCLCAMTDASQPDFVEAAMYVLPVGSRDNTSPAAPRVDAVTSVSHDSVL